MLITMLCSSGFEQYSRWVPLECGHLLPPAIRLHTVPPSGLSIGSLSNDDGDVNENGEKAIGLDCRNNNFARASRFFVHFFTFSAMPNFTSAVEDVGT